MNLPKTSGVVPSFARLAVESAGPALRMLIRPSTLAQLPRLWREGTGPARRLCIQAHNTRAIKQAAAHDVPITFIQSWARSGSTFLRYLLSDIFLQLDGVETSTTLPVHPEQIIADFYCNLIAKCDARVSTPGLVVKTHDLFDEVRRSFWGEGSEADASFRRCRHLYSCRSPEDCLVSLYHGHLREKWVEARFPAGSGAVTIDSFCRDSVKGWIQHVGNFVEAAENGAPVFFVTYEELKANTPGALSRILDWMGLPHSEAMVNRAASNMEFQKLKEADPGRFGPLRHGRSGGGVAELKPATLGFLRAETDSLYARVRALAETPATPAALVT